MVHLSSFFAILINQRMNQWFWWHHRLGSGQKHNMHEVIIVSQCWITLLFCGRLCVIFDPWQQRPVNLWRTLITQACSLFLTVHVILITAEVHCLLPYSFNCCYFESQSVYVWERETKRWGSWWTINHPTKHGTGPCAFPLPAGIINFFYHNSCATLCITDPV